MSKDLRHAVTVVDAVCHLGHAGRGCEVVGERREAKAGGEEPVNHHVGIAPNR